jgi:hypothetical protein
VSVIHLIVATRSSGPPASGKIIKEMPGSVASGTPYICCGQHPKDPLEGFSCALVVLIIADWLMWNHVIMTP